MDIFDLIIVYSACGAPFAFDYYFRTRETRDSKTILSKSFFVFLFWLPCAAFHLWKISFEKYKLLINAIPESDIEKNFVSEKNLFPVQKQIEYFCFGNDSQISIYEFREVCQRYAGLTIAVRNQKVEITSATENFFHIAGKKNNKLSAVCFQRRNRKRIIEHQNSARKDFLQIINKLFAFHSNEKALQALAVEFVTLLSDFDAQNEIKKLFVERSQNEKVFALKRSKKELWNRELANPLPAEQTSLHLQTLKITTNLRSKD